LERHFFQSRGHSFSSEATMFSFLTAFLSAFLSFSAENCLLVQRPLFQRRPLFQCRDPYFNAWAWAPFLSVQIISFSAKASLSVRRPLLQYLYLICNVDNSLSVQSTLVQCRGQSLLLHTFSLSLQSKLHLSELRS